MREISRAILEGGKITVSYYIAKSVDGPFDDVVADVTARLKEEGFGVLTDIDVQATLKSKIGAAMGRYRILDGCNPRLASTNSNHAEHR